MRVCMYNLIQSYVVSTIREAQNVLIAQRKEKWLLAKLIIRNNFIKEMAFKVSLPRSLGSQPVKLGRKRRPGQRRLDGQRCP